LDPHARAEYIDKVLRGTKPSERPIEQATQMLTSSASASLWICSCDNGKKVTEAIPIVFAAAGDRLGLALLTAWRGLADT